MEGDADCCFLSIRLLSRLLHLKLGNFFGVNPSLPFIAHSPSLSQLATTSILLHDIRILYLARLIIILTRWEKKIRQKWPTSTCPLLPLSDLVSFFLFLIHLKADFREDVMGEKAFSKRK